MIDFEKKIKTYGECVKCGELRTSRAWVGSTAKCWNKWSMCKDCAKQAHPEDYRTTYFANVITEITSYRNVVKRRITENRCHSRLFQ